MSKQATGKKSPWGIVNGFVIPTEDGSVYLTRWGARTPFGGFYVHRMTGPDERQIPHDHPWAFVSLILKGGYIEKRINKHDTHAPLQTKWHRRWTLNHISRDDAHFIRSLLANPTWTLVLFGRRKRTWGFWFQEDAVGEWRWIEFDKTQYEQERIMRASGLPYQYESTKQPVEFGAAYDEPDPWANAEKSDPTGDMRRWVDKYFEGVPDDASDTLLRQQQMYGGTPPGTPWR